MKVARLTFSTNNFAHHKILYNTRKNETKHLRIFVILLIERRLKEKLRKHKTKDKEIDNAEMTAPEPIIEVRIKRIKRLMLELKEYRRKIGAR